MGMTEKRVGMTEGRVGMTESNRQARRLSYGIGKRVEKKRWE